MSKFQIIFIAIILIAVVITTLILAGVLPGLPGVQRGPVAELTVWGFLPKESFNEAIDTINEKNEKVFRLKYVEKSGATYEEDLVNALASGKGPDIFILTQNMVLKHKSKVFKVPFTVFSERSFKDTFIDSSDLFILRGETKEDEDGFLALPFLVDPVVLFYNKDIFNRAGLAKTPKYWEDFLSDCQEMTKKDNEGNVFESGCALGEFANIRNAKDIISMLVLQGGNEIVDKTDYDVVFGSAGDAVVDPASSAVNFYTTFSNPSKVSYSWNRALPRSDTMFSSGKLAMYFGFSSEYAEMEQRNPHLNFDVALVPQIKNAPFSATFGTIYGLSISKNSPNVNMGIKAIFGFIEDDVLAELERGTGLAPVKRSLLAKNDTDPLFSVFYKSALQARAWLEPDSRKVSDIFKRMIDSVNTGQKSVSGSVGDAKTLLRAEIAKIK